MPPRKGPASNPSGILRTAGAVKGFRVINLVAQWYPLPFFLVLGSLRKEPFSTGTAIHKNQLLLRGTYRTIQVAGVGGAETHLNKP